MNTIGKRLRAARAAKGDPPQTRVAEVIGVSIRSYNGWEDDRQRPGYNSAQLLAEYYETTAEWILFGANITDDKRLSAIEAKLDVIIKLLRGNA